MSRLTWWLSDPELGAWQLPAARTAGLRLVGGALIGTPDGVRFVPNRVEALAGSRPWEVRQAEIADLTLGRRRLRITTADGERVTFWINRLFGMRRTALSHLLDLTPST